MRKLNVNKSSAMSRSTKTIPQPKKVAPPLVPIRYSSGASANDDGGFKKHLMEPLSPLNGSCLYQRNNAKIDPISHKAAVYYHQQYELDQGIDLTQSPGRDSPGSSSGSAGSGSGSRHSTVSLDSGRSSSYLMGSVDRMNQQSDHDMILNWLMILNLDELLPYAGNFSSAGYDLGTILRMTPEDLTAIGICNPTHREIIKAHIDDLQVNDSLPNYVPGSIDEWLRLLRLDEYIISLQNEGFQSVRDMTKLNEEDLEDIGIIKLGHQKKILLAIKRVKEILNGKNVVPSVNYCQHSSNNASIHPQLNDGHERSIQPTFFDPRIFGHGHQPNNYNPQAIHTHYIEKASLNFRRSYDDGELTPTNEVIDSKSEASHGGTLPRQQRQGKRSLSSKIDIPTPLQLFNTDYTAEARKQMSMYYNYNNASSSSTDLNIIKKQSGSLTENELCQKVGKCFIDVSSLNCGRSNLQTTQFQTPYNNQNIFGGNFGKNYAGQFQTQAEVHVDTQMSNSSIDSIDQIPFANENNGTIKQRQLNRDLPQSASSSSTSSSNSSASTAIQTTPICKNFGSTSPTNANASECDTNDDSDTVFHDINIMLNRLNGEIDTMILDQE